MDLKLPERKKNKKDSLFKILALVLVVALFGCVSGFYAALKMGQITLLEILLALMPQNDVKGSNILVLGIDDTKGMKRSDTIIVAHIEPRTRRIGVISIPRDTRVDVPGVGMTKINHAYAYGQESLTKRTVEAFLNVPIDHVVKVYVKGVEDLIDKLGGVKVNVEKKMYYIDRHGGLYVDLKPGVQVLNGKQAIGYLRFRHDAEGDFGRIRRQQDFLTVVASQVMNTGKFWDIPRVMNELSSNISTDLSSREIVSLALHGSKSLKEKKVETTTVPGGAVMVGGISYWQPDIVATRKLVDKVLYGISNTAVSNGYDEMSTKISDNSFNKKLKSLDNISKKNKDERDDYSISDHNKNVTVEVLNGNGIMGVAHAVSKKISKQGIKVYRIGNASHQEYENTILIDWKGNSKEAKKIAKLFNIESSKIILYDKPQKKMDLTLVLGKDWDNTRGKVF